MGDEETRTHEASPRAEARTAEPQPPAAILEGLEEEHALQADDDAVPDDTDGDSAYSGSNGSGSYLSSLNSSIINYKYENGRRYHAFREGTYLVPNDEEEQERMDLVHHIYSLCLSGKLHLAPISDTPNRVLDLGTGTGIWAMDFADAYPSADVLGTDLSPIQPKWTPPNCSFEVDDFEADWLYSRPFDFIHARELEGCIGDPDKFIEQAFRCLGSGGYFEFQGVVPPFMSDDGTGSKAEHANRWMKTICEGAEKFGKPMDIVAGWKEKMKDAGFLDVQQEIHKIPVGSWPKDPKLKEIGRYQAVQELQVIDSYTPAIFSRVLGWSHDEIQVFMAKVKKDLANPQIHVYLPACTIWGRKP